MTIQPGNYDFTIYQGATFSRILTWKDGAGNPVNLTGYTARLQMRASQDADTPFASLTNASGITLGGVAGTIALTMSDAITSAITTNNGVYDLELISSVGVVTRLLEGNVLISKEVTR